MNKALSIVVVAAIATLSGACSQDDPPTSEPTNPASSPDAPTAGSPSDLATLAADAQTCGSTPASTAGPYYVSGTRELTDGNLNYDDLDGTPMTIGGYVYASEENSDPVAGAKIDIWQTDGEGAYHPQAQGPASGFDADEISLRGHVTANDDGYYEFSSILPGEYEGRTRHIHVRVDAEGHETLISQIIVAKDGDRFPPDQDMIASRFPECSIVEPTERDGVQTAVFNFHLR